MNHMEPALAAGGFKKAARHALVLQAFLGAVALDDFAHDNHRTQSSAARTA